MKRNQFFIEEMFDSFTVRHRQIVGESTACATFYYLSCTVSKTRAKKAARVFCKQMNSYYPYKVTY